MLIRRSILSVVCPALLYFSTLSHKRQDFREKKFSEQKYVFRFSLQLLPKTCYILRRTERDMFINVKSVFMESTCYSCQILMKLEFFTTGLGKLLKYQIS